MAGGVVFDEGGGYDPLPAPRIAPPTFADALLNARIASTPGSASAMLVLVAIAIIGFSFYLLASAAKAPPTLGSDQLRPGEEVPAYVHH